MKKLFLLIGSIVLIGCTQTSTQTITPLEGGGYAVHVENITVDELKADYAKGLREFDTNSINSYQIKMQALKQASEKGDKKAYAVYKEMLNFDEIVASSITSHQKEKEEANELAQEKFNRMNSLPDSNDFKKLIQKNVQNDITTEEFATLKSYELYVSKEMKKGSSEAIALHNEVEAFYNQEIQARNARILSEEIAEREKAIEELPELSEVQDLIDKMADNTISHEEFILFHALTSYTEDKMANGNSEAKKLYAAAVDYYNSKKQ